MTLPLLQPRLWRLFGAALGLLAVFGAVGCASPLVPPLASAETPVCSEGDGACFREGRRAFELYRRAKISEIEGAKAGYRLPSAPVGLFHPKRTEYAALLIHGLNDSAYYMADIAKILHEQGFNVVTVLLPGHGTRTEDMLEVTAEQWRAEVRKGLAMAALVGRRVTVGGFSVGAALALDAMLGGVPIEGLFLFAPVVRFRLEVLQAFGGLTCLPGLKTVTVETDIAENPVKYKHRTANGVCQTYRVAQNNAVQGSRGQGGAARWDQAAERMGGKVTVPSFVALTFADARVLPDSILEFASAIGAPVTLVTFGPEGRSKKVRFRGQGRLVHIADEPLPHSFLVRRANPFNGQSNPYFEQLNALLTEHLQTHFPKAARDRT